MSQYEPPLDDILFTLQHVVGYPVVATLPGNEEASWDLVEAVLEEAGKVAGNVLSPLNKVGDQHGCKLTESGVTTPEGWKQAHNELSAGGWIGLALPTEHGGQGLPCSLASAVSEMWNGANVSFSLCNLLTQAAIEAISCAGSPDLKARYIPKMMSGEWTGTMNLTEPQAGSDLAAIRTKAIPQGDHYLISGQKIFITYGDHDLSENIIHMVLARTPEAPAGIKGISMFLVPKINLDEQGNPTQANDLRCVSIEHKLGIHGSPTCAMSYGDQGGAIGYLIGEENRGLEYMFIMMNRSRHEVGIQGLGLAEIAYQNARDYAKERVQGAVIDRVAGTAIIGHPDVRRMLMTMKCQIEALRAATYSSAIAMDMAARHSDPDIRQFNQRRTDFLTPLIKGWNTEVAQEIASLGLQIHGGMGYIEETGVAQHFRDSRITTIYEGTTGIQATDLVFRKTIRDNGEAAFALIEELKGLDRELASNSEATFIALRKALDEGTQLVKQATDWLLLKGDPSPGLAAAGAVPYLALWGTVYAGFQMARSALVAQSLLEGGAENVSFLKAKIISAQFYAVHIMPRGSGYYRSMTEGAEIITALEDSQF